MKYIKNHKYGIEERAKAMFGTTEIHEFAGYIFENGEMLNLSYEGYQRDEDHRIISQFFSTAYDTDAMHKFMRRGNIRVMCSRTHYFFEFIKKPTKAQINQIRNAYLYAYKNGIEFMIERSDNKGHAVEQFYDLYEFLEKYNTEVYSYV